MSFAEAKLPPRLVHHRMLLDPPLPATVWHAMENTATWMATHAKALVAFDHAFWREAGQSGNAFVRHAQAVLGEVFDACDEANGAALGGFVALNPAQREHFQRGLPLLIDSQLAQLYGQAAQSGRLQWQDWALEPWTCSDTDRATPPEPPLADPLLRQPQWSGRVFLGGSETAAHGAGHMEGALEAADRIAHALLRQKAPTATPQAPLVQDREAALRAFAEGVAARAAAAPDQYRRHLTRLLSSQQHELLTQRALLATVDRVYSESLAQIDALLPALDAADASSTRAAFCCVTSSIWLMEEMTRAGPAPILWPMARPWSSVCSRASCCRSRPSAGLVSVSSTAKNAPSPRTPAAANCCWAAWACWGRWINRPPEPPLPAVVRVRPRTAGPRCSPSDR